MNEFNAKNARRAANQARAIARKAGRQGREVSGRDKVAIQRINGSTRKVMLRDTGDPE